MKGLKSVGSQQVGSTYKDDLLSMQKIFAESERLFLEFTDIVPLEHNPPDVYSPKLAIIIQSVSSQIDGMLKLIISELLGIKKRMDYPTMVQKLDEKGMLSAQKLTLQVKMEPLTPFKDGQSSWWKAYNNLKHELPAGLYSATLNNTIKALGALFALHSIAEILYLYSIPEKEVNMRQPRLSVLDQTYWYDFEEEFRNNPGNQRGIKFMINQQLIYCAPMTLAKLQPYTWTDVGLHSKVFFHLSFYHGVWGTGIIC